MDEITLSASEASALLENLHQFSVEEQQQILAMLSELESRKQADARRNSLLEFAKAVQPDYKVGLHHKKLAELLEDMAYGRKDRVTVSIAPRMGKSLLTSTIFPAWFIGNFPNKKIMLVSHTADLAVDFGRKVRNIVATEAYSAIFPDVKLSTDSKSAGRWSTNQGGEFFAVGIGGAIAGRGADFLCLLESSQVKVKRQNENKSQVVEIKEVLVGDSIQTISGWERITAKWLTTKEGYVIVNGVTCTPEHPFLTKRGWVAAGALRADDKILTDSIWRKLWRLKQQANLRLKTLLEKRGRA